jgi:hypothetical protein
MIPGRFHMGRHRIENHHPEILDLLGKMPDFDLAKRFGCSQPTVARLRKERNIPHMGHLLNRQPEPGADPTLADTDLVVVLARIHDHGDEGYVVDLLNARDGVRVYHKDLVDPRVLMAGPIEHFHSWSDCQAYLLAEGPGQYRPCLLDLAAARQVFKTNFGEPPRLPNPVFDKILIAAKAEKGLTLSPADVASLVR